MADQTFNASAISRNFRTLWTCAIISADYKINFTPEHADRIPQIHQRVADRMYDLFTKNGGLYIKIGKYLVGNVYFVLKVFLFRPSHRRKCSAPAQAHAVKIFKAFR